MTWLIDFFSKIFAIRQVVAVLYIASRVVWLASLVSFVGFAGFALFSLWEQIGQLFTSSTSSIASNTVAGNDLSALIEGGLNALGFYTVMNIYAPLYLTSLSFYMGYSAFKVALKAKDKILTSFRNNAGLFLGR